MFNIRIFCVQRGCRNNVGKSPGYTNKHAVGEFTLDVRTWKCLYSVNSLTLTPQHTYEYKCGLYGLLAFCLSVGGPAFGHHEKVVSCSFKRWDTNHITVHRHVLSQHFRCGVIENSLDRSYRKMITLKPLYSNINYSFCFSQN